MIFFSFWQVFFLHSYLKPLLLLIVSCNDLTWNRILAELFILYIPRWLAMTDRDVLKGYFEGESSFYLSQNMKAWFIPILLWSAFITVLWFVMICINVIIKRQWTQRERLAYPIIQLPLEMTRCDNPKQGVCHHPEHWEIRVNRNFPKQE